MRQRNDDDVPSAQGVNCRRIESREPTNGSFDLGSQQVSPTKLDEHLVKRAFAELSRATAR